MIEKFRSILEMNSWQVRGDNSPAVSRRLSNMGPAAVLFYREPIQMRRGEGVWLEATDGTRYLDCYNNVPSVGHCHPHVVEAASRQIAELNIHSRYLSDVVDSYLERLLATFPDPLVHAVLTCSGSEANDLAMRMAVSRTGNRGFIVTEAAYHGNTTAVAGVSPSSWKQPKVPDHVRLVPAPSTLRYGDDIAAGFAAAVAAAAQSLDEAGYGLAAFLCDSAFSSDGIHLDPVGFLAPAVTAARAAGGIYIADEVQPGFGRLGHGMWGFARHGVIPDLVTMGKPMGNGFPMAGLVGTHEIFAAFCEDTGYFNTFGGNPVAAAAGSAVLDCIASDDLIGNAARIGGLLLSGLTDIAATGGSVREIRGSGLFIGIELADTDMAADARVLRLIDALRQRRVLAGAAGRSGETVKLRPPLCINEREAEFFLDAMEAALRAI